MATMVPATWRAATAKRVMPPIKGPTSNSPPSRPARRPGSAGGAGGRPPATTGATSVLSRSPSSSRWRASTYCSPKPGSSINAVPSRAKTSITWNSSRTSVSVSTARPSARRADLDDLAVELAGEVLEGDEDEGRGQREGEQDRDQLRHERQGRFLDRGQRLDERDRHAHQESHDHRRRADLDHHPDPGPGDVDHLLRRHTGILMISW